MLIKHVRVKLYKSLLKVDIRHLLFDRFIPNLNGYPLLNLTVDNLSTHGPTYDLGETQQVTKSPEHWKRTCRKQSG